MFCLTRLSATHTQETFGQPRYHHFLDTTTHTMKHWHFWKLLVRLCFVSYLPHCGHVSYVFWHTDRFALLIPYMTNNLHCMFRQCAACTAQGSDEILCREVVSGCCAVGISREHHISFILQDLNKVSHFTPNKQFFSALCLYALLKKHSINLYFKCRYFTSLIRWLLYPLLMCLNMQKPSFAGLTQHAK